jgi:hypothetical protein
MGHGLGLLGFRREILVGEFQQLVARVAVHGRRRAVGFEDATRLVVDEEHGVGLRFEQLPVALLALLQRISLPLASQSGQAQIGEHAHQIAEEADGVDHALVREHRDAR